MSKGTVLLTGANGFVAVHIITVLLEKGYAVVGTVRSQSKIPYLEAKFKGNPNLKFAIVQDITTPDAFGPVLKEYRFDHVLHTSSPFTLIATDVENDLYEPAIKGTVGVLKSIKAHVPSVKRVVMISSFAAVSTPPKDPRPGYKYTAEDWNPVTREEGLANGYVGYYASKKLAELAALEFMETENPSFTLTRLCPPMIYGPPEQELESLESLNTSVAEIYAIFTGKAEARNSGWVWVDVRDVALASVLALESPAAPGQRYLLTQGNYSAQWYLDYMWAHYPERVREKGIFRGTPDKLYPEGGVYTADVAKSERDLGFKYRIFDVMIKDTLEKLVELEMEGK